LPPAFVVSTRAYRAALRAVGGPFAIDAADPLPSLERAQAALRCAPMPDGLEPELRAAADALAPGATFAVRSSATVEDVTARAALALERAANGSPLDIEWVRAPAGELSILQRRPITAFAPSPFSARPPDGARWTLDAEHNPDPLSPAQQGLVALAARLAGPR